jgi:hypothetical protein
MSSGAASCWSLRPLGLDPPNCADVGVARVEEDHAAGAQIAVQLGVGLVRGDRLVGGHGPVEEREERQLVGLQIDGDGFGRFDRGALEQGLRQAAQPRLGHVVEPRVARDDMREHDGSRGFDREDVLGFLRGRGLGQDQRERQHRGRRAAGAPQAAREPERREDVEEERSERQRQERALEQRLLFHREAFDGMRAGHAAGASAVAAPITLSAMRRSSPA